MKHSITILGSDRDIEAFKAFLHAHLLSSATVPLTPVTNLKRFGAGNQSLLKLIRIMGM